MRTAMPRMPCTDSRAFSRTFWNRSGRSASAWRSTPARAAQTSFRNGIYPAYKANRESPPADLERQFALCREFCRHMGVAEFASAEYEADDIIGTLAARSRAAGLRNVLVTRDKDLSQLIRDGDVFWDYSGNVRYHYRDIEPRFGAAPELIADFLALTGDSVDNIPGVPGVGKKTAAELFACSVPWMSCMQIFIEFRR